MRDASSVLNRLFGKIMKNYWLEKADPPTRVWGDGAKHWYLDGTMILHREGDKPAAIWEDGTKFWFVNGVLHRVDGPAIKWPSGASEWYFQGMKHRTNGPAAEASDGTKWYWLLLWMQSKSLMKRYAWLLMCLKQHL